MMGLLGKIVPLSLVAARSFSLVCMVAAFILMIFALRASMPSPLVAVLIGFYWLSDPFVVTGNIGRMEAPLLVLLLSGFLLLRKGHVWKALALFAAAPLIHPNGLFFTLACVLWGVAFALDLEKVPDSPGPMPYFSALC